MYIDIDSYDIWLFKALVTGGFRPRVLTVEYNGRGGSRERILYCSGHMWA